MAGSLGVISLVAALLLSAGELSADPAPVHEVAGWLKMHGLEWGMAESHVIARVQCATERQRVNDESCVGFRCMDQSSTFGGSQQISACFADDRLWKVQLHAVPAPRSGASCEWFEAAWSELSETLGSPTCRMQVDKRFECTWSSSPDFAASLVRDDRLPGACADALIFFDPREAERVARLAKERSENVQCGRRKSPTDLQAEAVDLDRELQNLQHVLGGYRARSRALALATTSAATARAEFPALSFREVWDLSGTTPEIPKDPKFYESVLSRRVARYERVRGCLASVVDSRGLNLADGCREVMCLPEHGVRGRCVFSVQLLEDGRREETTYNVDALRIGEDDRAAGKEFEVRACSIAAQFPGRDRKPTVFGIVMPALNYYTADTPRNVKELAPRCVAETKVLNDGVGKALEDYPQDPWLRVLKNSVTSRLQLCQKNAQRYCENVYRVRDSWALAYVTRACTVRKVMESDVDRDVERWRRSGTSTDAELAEHEVLKDVLVACRQFADAGVSWKFEDPIPAKSPGCKPKAPTPKRKRAKPPLDI